MADCKPETENPADQPKAPECKCDPPVPGDPAPSLPPPPKGPDPKCCNCPEPPPTVPTCFDDAIKQQIALISGAKAAEAVKSELEGLLKKAKDASAAYTQDKYAELLDAWKKQDGRIIDKLHNLHCNVPCWRCIIECYICPLLKEMRDAEWKLYGERKKIENVYTIYDLRYWQDRDLVFKTQTFDRVKTVLGDWEAPAKTIEDTLKENAKILDSLCVDGPKAVFDLILKVIPRHLAIAPPASVWKTKIDKKYTQFCEFDTPNPDDCCGPDVGIWSVRQRLVGALPYLVKPSEYFKIICCLVEKRYLPAKNAVAAADAALKATDDEIKRLNDLVKSGVAGFDEKAKNAIPAKVRCCDDKLAPEEPPKTKEATT